MEEQFKQMVGEDSRKLLTRFLMGESMRKYSEDLQTVLDFAGSQQWDGVKQERSAATLFGFRVTAMCGSHEIAISLTPERDQIVMSVTLPVQVDEDAIDSVAVLLNRINHDLPFGRIMLSSARKVTIDVATCLVGSRIGEDLLVCLAVQLETICDEAGDRVIAVACGDQTLENMLAEFDVRRIRSGSAETAVTQDGRSTAISDFVAEGVSGACRMVSKQGNTILGVCEVLEQPCDLVAEFDTLNSVSYQPSSTLRLSLSLPFCVEHASPDPLAAFSRLMQASHVPVAACMDEQGFIYMVASATVRGEADFKAVASALLSDVRQFAEVAMTDLVRVLFPMNMSAALSPVHVDAVSRSGVEGVCNDNV